MCTREAALIVFVPLGKRVSKAGEREEEEKKSTLPRLSEKEFRDRGQGQRGERLCVCGSQLARGMIAFTRCHVLETKAQGICLSSPSVHIMLAQISWYETKQCDVSCPDHASAYSAVIRARSFCGWSFLFIYTVLLSALQHGTTPKTRFYRFRNSTITMLPT